MCRSIKTIHKVMSFYCVTPSRLFKRCYFTVSLHQDYSQDDVISVCRSIKTFHKVMSFYCVTPSRLFTRCYFTVSRTLSRLFTRCYFTVSRIYQDYLQCDVISLCHSVKTIHNVMSFHCVTQSRLFTRWCHFTVSLDQDYSHEDVTYITEFLWWDSNLESSLQTKTNKFPARPINFTVPSVGRNLSGTPENPTTTSTLRCDIINLFSVRKRKTQKKEKSWEKSSPKWNDKCVVMLNCMLVPNLLLFGVSVVWLWLWVRRGITRTLEGFWRLCGTRFRAERV